MYKLYPLTHQQSSLMNIEKIYSNTTINIAAGSVKFKNKIDVSVFEKAINIFIQNNDAVRIRYTDKNGIVKQTISDYQYKKIDCFDFSNFKKEKELYEWEENTTNKPFNLYNNDLYYFAIVKVSNDEYWFYAKMHHSITDHWSMGIMVKEIIENYAGLGTLSINQANKSRQAGLVPQSHKSYLEYVESENIYKDSPDFNDDKEFWEKKFQSIPEFIDFDNNLLKPYIGLQNLKSARKSFIIPKDMVSKIKEFCKKSEISEFVFFIAVYFIYIYKITGKNDLLLNTSLLNRSKKNRMIMGLFTSIIPFRIEMKEEYEFNELLKALTQNWMEVIYHNRYPIELIQEHTSKKHESSNIFNHISFNYHISDFTNKVTNLDYSIRWHNYNEQIQSLNIHISNREGQDEYVMNLDYLTDLFEDKKINQMFDHYNNLLKDIIQNPDKKIYNLNILSSNETDILLYNFNNTKHDYPDNVLIHELFEDQAKKTPDKIALVYNNEKITYKELSEKTTRIANYLRNIYKLKNEEIIGILIKNSINQVIALLSVLKAGGAYLALDIQNPVYRINSIIKDSEINLIISETGNEEIIKILEKDKILKNKLYINNDQLFDDIKNIELLNNKNHLSSSNLCYVIYTSGSTGNPKGVMIEHRSLVNLCFWYIKNFNITENDNATRYSAFGFDASVWELFPNLIKGASIHILNDDLKFNIKELNNYYEKNNITVSFLPTQFCEQFIKFENKSLRILQAAGDKLRYYQKTKYQLTNNYGPTEYTVCASSYIVEKQMEDIPIGKPIANTKVYILDKHNQLVPIGAAGELCISGKGIARGYLNNHELTKERFINNPFMPDERIYKTGDMAKWREDGNIEFIGRIDDQVKIRGFRIELKDIEKNLLLHPDVLETAVIVKENQNKEKMLAAFFTLKKDMDIAVFKKFLKEKLPEYMIPVFFIKLDNFPLLPSGKIDKISLSKIEINTNKDIINPTNDMELKLLKIWKKVLKVKRISIDDNFFDLGGDSLKVIQAVSEASRLNIKVQDFFNYPTIRSLSKRIQEGNAINKNNKSDYNNEIFQKQNEQGDAAYCFPIKNTIELKDIKLSGKKNKIDNVLLTGSTGFVGSHLLDQLYNTKVKKIYCLVRGLNQEESKNRLQKILDYYFPEKYFLNKPDRIQVLNGEITEENLGLDKDEYQKLIKKIDTVFHSAAVLKFYGPYSDFERVNVHGTKTIIDFCMKSNAKLNYISTLSVSGIYYVEQTKNNPSFSENDFYIGQKYQDHPYPRSKFEAENLIYIEMEKGLNASIYRLGAVAPRVADGKFQFNDKENLYQNVIKEIIELKIIPELFLNAQIDFSPVDFCTESIIKLSQLIESNGRVFHFFNPANLRLKDIIPNFYINGIDIKILKNTSYKEYIQYLNKNHKDKKESIQIFTPDLNLDMAFDKKNQVEIKSDITQKFLKLLGITYPVIDNRYIKYFIDAVKG